MAKRKGELWLIMRRRPRGGGKSINYLVCNGEVNGTIINFGSVLDDLHDNEFTAELYLKSISPYAPKFIYKGDTTSIGWVLRALSSARLQMIVYCATTNAAGYSASNSLPIDGNWYHVVGYFNEAGDRKPYLAINGTWSNPTQTAGVDAVVTDAAYDLKAAGYGGSYSIEGGLGWARISNNDRYGHGVNFVPPSRLTPPDIDANTVEQWNFNEGTGTTATAQVNSPADDGSISQGDWANE